MSQEQKKKTGHLSIGLHKRVALKKHRSFQMEPGILCWAWSNSGERIAFRDCHVVLAVLGAGSAKCLDGGQRNLSFALKWPTNVISFLEEVRPALLVGFR